MSTDDAALSPPSSSKQSPGVVRHRFTLVLSGAVALGSHIAGVISQLYRDFWELNSTGRYDLKMDVIAGSSAGSVTGLILARAIAQNRTPDELDAALHACWVEMLDLVEMVSPPASKSNSLITSELLEQVVARVHAMMPDRAAAASDAGPSQENSVALWITMTNLDGIPRIISFPAAGSEPTDTIFIANNYRDYSPFFFSGDRFYHVHSPTHALGTDAPLDFHPADWETVASAARVSGAFPFAFQSQSMERELELYPEYAEFLATLDDQDRALPWMEGLAMENDRVKMACVDGGLLNNQPIGRAITATAYMNKHRLGSTAAPGESRTFLVVEPDPNTAKDIAQSFVASTSSKEQALFGVAPDQLVGRIVNLYFTDALYDDFRRAEKTNRQLVEVERRLRSYGLDDAAVNDVMGAMGLDYKQLVMLSRIPRSVEGRNLLCSGMGHFSGFLYRPWREHDFALGRIEARWWLEHFFAGAPVASPVPPLPSVSPNRPDPSLLPQARRNELGAAVAKRAYQLFERAVTHYVPRPIRLGLCAAAGFAAAGLTSLAAAVVGAGGGLVFAAWFIGFFIGCAFLNSFFEPQMDTKKPSST
jgi:predicted acylesterase/phospholipase RssA